MYLCLLHACAMINIYQIQGVTNEPTGNSEKSEPQMGFEPMEVRRLESHLGLGFFRVPSGFLCNTLYLIYVNHCLTFTHLCNEMCKLQSVQQKPLEIEEILKTKTPPG